MAIESQPSALRGRFFNYFVTIHANFIRILLQYRLYFLRILLQYIQGGAEQNA